MAHLCSFSGSSVSSPCNQLANAAGGGHGMPKPVHPKQGSASAFFPMTHASSL